MIREATVQDLEEILEIYNDAIVNSTAVYSYEPQTLENRVNWFEQKQAEGFPIIVFESEGRVAGFATFGTFRAWPAFKYSVEHSIYVSSNFRKQGIGRTLLKELISLANAGEYKTLIGGIDASNDKSIALHTQLGFTHSGTIQNAGYKFNRWLDLAFYQLDLDGPKQPTED